MYTFQSLAALAFGITVALPCCILMRKCEKFPNQISLFPGFYWAPLRSCRGMLRLKAINTARPSYSQVQVSFVVHLWNFCHTSIHLVRHFKRAVWLIHSVQHVSVLCTSGKELLDCAPLAVAGSRNMVGLGGVSTVNVSNVMNGLSSFDIFYSVVILLFAAVSPSPLPWP